MSFRQAPIACLMASHIQVQILPRLHFQHYPFYLTFNLLITQSLLILQIAVTGFWGFGVLGRAGGVRGLS